MYIYFIYLLIVAIQAIVLGNVVIVTKKNKCKKCNINVFLVLSCIELILLAGLRGHKLGADIVTYLAGLNHYRGISFSEIFTAKLVWPYKFETGYFLLTKACAHFGVSETTFLFLIAIIIYIPVFIYISKNSKHYFISILIYFSFGFFEYSLGIFRQMIAVGIILLGLKFIYEKKICKYLATVLVASTFHITALLAVVLYPLYYMNHKKYFKWIFVGEILLLLVGKHVMIFVFGLFPSYAGYISEITSLNGDGFTNLIFLNVVYILYLWVDRNEIEMEKSDKIMITQLAVAILMQCLGYYSEIFGRIVPYFSIAVVYAIPNLMDKFLNGRDKYIASGILVILLVGLFYISLQNSLINPYSFMWD